MTILVTGATANVGRMLVDALLAAGETDVRALTVSPRRAALPSGVDVVVGQVGRPETVRPALEGVDRMYLAPSPSTAREVAALAAAAGVRRIVDLAGGEGGSWHAIEGDVEASGVAWTHLEPGEFMSNALDWADEIRTEGAVRDAHPTSANAPIDMRDIAAVAAATLLRDDHAGRRYPLTGPQSLTRAEMVATIGAALGREVPYVELTHEEAIARKAARGMGEEVARWYVEGMALLVEHPQQADPSVERILGRPATTFAQWARDNVDAFRAP
ncbi:NAD(P)H-binding protein [Pseudonocardia humida]|uniref:NAD(P)H-binding protein n=1 Tax=Pseudonocardia humida TaxID=2800819 RepID=A0ABT1A0Q7_9PSEU|nr:NAD(P)H-binding protein [Pseudonocardia humida]MCO1656523.1 NAD(P)H-binding protein [Pseudonocardia humida]